MTQDAAENDAVKAETPVAEGAGGQLNDHFHRVRLTSFVLSSTLLLLSLRDSPTEPLALLGVQIAAANVPFVLLAVGIAALFSLCHACSIWYSQTRKFDEKMKAAADEMAKIRVLVKSFTVMEQRIGDRSNELLIRQTQLANEDGKVVDFDRAVAEFERIMEEAPTWSDLRDSDDDPLQFNIPQPELLNVPGPEVLYQALRPTLDKYLKPLEPNDYAMYENFIRSALRTELEAQRGAIMSPQLKYITHLEQVYPRVLKRLIGAAGRRVRQLIRVNEDAEQELRTSIEAAKTAVEKARSELVEPLAQARQDLSRALRPLKVANANEKLLIFGFDLWAAIGLFALAAVNALGSALAMGAPTIPPSTRAVINLVTGPYWWAWLNALLVIGAALLIALVVKYSNPPS